MEEKEAKIEELQMTGSDGGLDLPNLRPYQLAPHLRVMASRFKNDPTSVWFDIESKCSSLWNLLFIKDSKSLKKLCSNPTDPDFEPGHLDSGFRKMHTWG